MAKAGWPRSVQRGSSIHITDVPARDSIASAAHPAVRGESASRRAARWLGDRRRRVVERDGCTNRVEPAGMRSPEQRVTTAAACFAIAVGVLMSGWWTLDIRSGALRRPDRQPIEIGLHLAAELVTAALLVAGGIVTLTSGGTVVLTIALGMLLYTVIQSPGYFLARRERAPVVMFAILGVATVVAILAIT
jgi:hypothetical protein